MQKDYSVFPIPNFAKREAKSVVAINNESLEIFNELNAIAEEIEKCRLRNL